MGCSRLLSIIRSREDTIFSILYSFAALAENDLPASKILTYFMNRTPTLSVRPAHSFLVLHENSLPRRRLSGNRRFW